MKRFRHHCATLALLSTGLLLCSPIGCATMEQQEPAVVLERPKESRIPQQLSFLDLTLKKVFEDSDVNGTIHQYVLPDEAVDNWSRMFAVRFFPGTTVAPKAAVMNAKAIVDKRASLGDPFARSLIFTSEDGSSFAIDFLISQGTNLEHNVFRYYAVETGVMCYQFSRKLSGSSVSNSQLKSFVLEIPKIRQDVFAELNREDLPIPPEAVSPQAFLQRSDQLLELKRNSVEPSSH